MLCRSRDTSRLRSYPDEATSLSAGEIVAVVSLKIPPLPKRQEDIQILAEYFLQKYNLGLGKPVPGIPG